MLKKVLIVATTIISLTASATSLEEAQSLYGKRGADFKNAQLAADMYGKLVAAEADSFKKAKLLIGQSEAVQYVGTKTSGKKAKLKIHDFGKKLGDNAFALLKGNNTPEGKTQQARALYFMGTNLGRWGEAKGVLSSLGRWRKELRPAMELLMTLDDSVEDYGVYRIMGRGFIKVPGFNTPNDQGVKFLEKALEATKLDDYSVSKNSTTTTYLIWAYMKEGQTDEFCNLYEAFEEFTDADRTIQDEANTYLIPETQHEVNEFKNPTHEDRIAVNEYFNEEC